MKCHTTISVFYTGSKKRTFSVFYKFCTYPVSYVRNQKTYLFNVYYYKFRTNSVPITHFMCGIKAYIFNTLQIPYRFRTNSVFCLTSGQLQVFQNSIKNTLTPYLFFLKHLTYVNSVCYFL